MFQFDLKNYLKPNSFFMVICIPTTAHNYESAREIKISTCIYLILK